MMASRRADRAARAEFQARWADRPPPTCPECKLAVQLDRQPWTWIYYCDDGDDAHIPYVAHRRCWHRGALWNWVPRWRRRRRVDPGPIING